MTKKTKYKFTLKEPLSEKVYKITGIADLPFFGGGTDIKKVEFITMFLFPDTMDEAGLVGYIEMGRWREEALQKYDDGWRFAK